MEVAVPVYDARGKTQFCWSWGNVNCESELYEEPVEVASGGYIIYSGIERELKGYGFVTHYPDSAINDYRNMNSSFATEDLSLAHGMLSTDLHLFDGDDRTEQFRGEIEMWDSHQ